MKKNLLLISPFLMFAVFGCKDNSVTVPAHIISKDSMVNILTDIHIMEALHIQGSIKQEDSINNIENYKQQIVEKHKLDLKRFNESYNFYTENPQLLDQVYNDVLIEMSRKKAEVEY